MKKLQKDFDYLGSPYVIEAHYSGGIYDFKIYLDVSIQHGLKEDTIDITEIATDSLTEKAMSLIEADLDTGV